MFDRIVSQPTHNLQPEFPKEAEYDAWADGINGKATYQVVKSRFASYSWLSANHADSITRRGDMIIVRHHLASFEQSSPERVIAEWREFIASLLPEAALKRIDIDRKGDLRVRLYFPVPVVSCPVCGELTTRRLTTDAHRTP
jgi:hypothetical protein